MSEYEYVLVSLEELKLMTFEEIYENDFYVEGEVKGSHLKLITRKLNHFKIYASEGRLYTRKNVEWWENISEHGIFVWYKDEVYLVKYIKDKGCFCNGDWIFDVCDCKPLTDEEIKEIIKYFTGVKGE
jgi:hypothetical protein